MIGQDLIVVLTLNGSAVAGAHIKSHDIKTSADTIETASSTQNTWKEYIAGRCEWSINISKLVLVASEIRELLYIGQTFGVTVRDKDNNSSVSGTAIMTATGHQAAFGNLVQGSFTLKGTGALS